MSGNQCKLLLKYEGAALDNHSMDVAQLAPSLLALNEAIQELNKLVNNGQTRVTLKIDDPIKSGSIGIDLSIVQDFLSQVTNFLTSGEISAFCNAKTLAESILQIVMLRRYLQGRDPSLFVSSRTVSETVLVIDNRHFTINNVAYVGLSNLSCTNACSRLADPLHYEGVDSFSLSVGEKTETIKKEELVAYQAIQEEREVTRSSVKVAAIVESLSFKDEAKWKINIGDKNSIFVSIQDDQFAKDVDSGIELFGKGDYLIAQLESVQTITAEGKIKISYTITKVYEHKHAAEQLKLI